MYNITTVHTCILKKYYSIQFDHDKKFYDVINDANFLSINMPPLVLDN